MAASYVGGFPTRDADLGGVEIAVKGGTPTTNIQAFGADSPLTLGDGGEVVGVDGDIAKPATSDASRKIKGAITPADGGWKAV